MKIAVVRKAMPNYGRIIDLINPHECLDEPAELDLGPETEIVAFDQEEGEKKFVKKLNELKSTPGAVSTMDLRDRRKEPDIKSSAPASLVDSIQSMQNTAPAHGLEQEPEGE
jgi:hypothetical protein